ncbi:MAG: hypothetical protein DMD80_01645, partial [Candidatus Rokuibacteriota bacterium]
MARCLSVAFLLGSDRLRSAVVLPFVMTGLLATGCAQSRVATRTDKWERVPSSARVVLMTPDITVAELAAMTDEAHRHGKLTAAHCTSAQSVQNCLDADVDMIIHCIFNEPDGTYRFRPDLVDRLAKAKAWVNPTLYVQKAGIERQREAREREGRLTPELVTQLDAARRALDVKLDAVRRMSEAGVRMTAGSDSPWGWYAPGEFVHEIHMLAQAGLSYSDAIVAGTAGAAV